jgi:hypothetical protein
MAVRLEERGATMASKLGERRSNGRPRRKGGDGKIRNTRGES